MKNPAKRRRLITGIAGLLSYAALAATAMAPHDWFGSQEVALRAFLMLGFGVGAIGLMLLSAWIERANEKAMSPFWLRIKPAFWGAVLLTPAAVLTLGVVLIPVGIGFYLFFSLMFGGPIFLIVGAPVAWFALNRGRAGGLWGLLFGALAGVASTPILILFINGFGGGWRDLLDAFMGFAVLGCIFGALYGLLLGLLFDGLYGRARRRLLRRAAARQTPAGESA